MPHSPRDPQSSFGCSRTDWFHLFRLFGSPASDQRLQFCACFVLRKGDPRAQRWLSCGSVQSGEPRRGRCSFFTSFAFSVKACSPMMVLSLTKTRRPCSDPSIYLNTQVCQMLKTASISSAFLRTVCVWLCMCVCVYVHYDDSVQ
ncbi:hypothetical protein EYF80_010002 [Liparis tanakae]|uniref:Uncharacterized protein n=1 Tax=Liparis tanakae TaxID=230148 RepID=A0A4Z2IQ15_9TELE|nr:hypothetical protein EYF80_010002 [Liparis tanakae]